VSGIDNAEEQLNSAYAMTTGSPDEKRAEKTPDAKMEQAHGGLGAFFDQIMKNPVLLLIAVVILVFIIGKMF